MSCVRWLPCFVRTRHYFLEFPDATRICAARRQETPAPPRFSVGHFPYYCYTGRPAVPVLPQADWCCHEPFVKQQALFGLRQEPVPEVLRPRPECLTLNG